MNDGTEITIEALLDLALELDSRGVYALHSLGENYRDEGALDKAILCLRRAAVDAEAHQISPMSTSGIWVSLGLALTDAGELTEAERWLRKTIAFTERDPALGLSLVSALDALADCLLKDGRTKEAEMIDARKNEIAEHEMTLLRQKTDGMETKSPTEHPTSEQLPFDWSPDLIAEWNPDLRDYLLYAEEMSLATLDHHQHADLEPLSLAAHTDRDVFPTCEVDRPVVVILPTEAPAHSYLAYYNCRLHWIVEIPNEGVDPGLTAEFLPGTNGSTDPIPLVQLLLGDANGPDSVWGHFWLLLPPGVASRMAFFALPAERAGELAMAPGRVRFQPTGGVPGSVIPVPPVTATVGSVRELSGLLGLILRLRHPAERQACCSELIRRLTGVRFDLSSTETQTAAFYLFWLASVRYDGGPLLDLARASDFEHRLTQMSGWPKAFLNGLKAILQRTHRMDDAGERKTGE